MPADVKRAVGDRDRSQLEGPVDVRGQDEAPAKALRVIAATRIAEANPAYSRAPSGSKAKGPAPKVQGSYAGKDKARPATSTRDAQRRRRAARTCRSPSPRHATCSVPVAASADRGYGSAPERAT